MIIKGACPNCGGPITEKRLRAGLPCNKCLPDKYLKEVREKGLRHVITSLGKAKGLVNIFLLEDELKEFEEFFHSLTGKKFWSIQKAWARRILARESFALIAPTGVGKTTLLQTYAIFRAVKGAEVLYIVPTRELMKQVISSLKRLSGEKVPILDSEQFKKMRDDLPKGRIDVLTHAFIFRNKDMFDGRRYSLVVVDDFDALLKSSSLIDLILKALGISDEGIDLARKVVALKSELYFHKYTGNEEKVNEVSTKLYETELMLANAIGLESVGQLLIASATGRAKGTRIKVLRELLGFEVGSIMDYLRNIVELVSPAEEVDLADLIKRLEGGTLVFVSKELGISEAKRITEYLNSRGIKAAIANSRKPLEWLREGKADVLVGVSTYYGILTRGIDEPLRIYNTVFWGVPKFEFNLESLLTNPRGLAKALYEVSKKGYELGEEEKYLLRAFSRLSPGKLKVLQGGLRGYVELEGYLKELKERTEAIIPKVMNFISRYVAENGKFVTDSYIVVDKGGRLVARIPDVMTYIQASGRCSRLYKGSMTLGLSIVLYHDKDILRIFQRKLKNYVSAYEPKELSKADLEKIKEQQRASRSGKEIGRDVNRIKSALIVVESPTKARTIAKMFGYPGKRYLTEYIAYETVISLGKTVYVATIAPTLGHLLDLTVNEGLHGITKNMRGLTPMYTTIKRCYDCGYQFTEDVDKCPRCGSSRIRNSKRVIEALRKLAQEVDEVFLATDPDDEGEKIAYDVYLVLRPYNSSFKRIEFHEVTRKGFLKALKHPRAINDRRVSAQIVRRVDDRLIGFELSTVLKERLGKYWVGGGRVQTPVLRWIVDRYQEYLRSRGFLVVIKLPGRYRLTYFTKDKEEAEEVLKHLSENPVKLTLLKTEVRDINPKPPYTTDTLLSDGIRRLKLSPGKVMRLAQELFELGLITYHRTDSTHVSSTGIEIAKEYLKAVGKEAEIHPRGWGAEGTHECIRPTKPVSNLDDVEDSGFTLFNNFTWYHKRLYDLIFRRFIASQMRPAKVEEGLYLADLGRVSIEVKIPVRIIEAGFTQIDPILTLPNLYGKEEILIQPEEVKLIKASEVRLFTASDVIRLMKEKEIGRPSTYAKAVENNMRHGYVIASKRLLYLIPTKLGMEVADLVSKYYPELASIKATREMEDLLDLVREGKLSRHTALVLLLSDVIRIRYGERLMKMHEEGEGIKAEAAGEAATEA